MEVYSFESIDMSLLYSSKWIKELPEEEYVTYISLLWSTNKVQRFFFEKKKNERMREASNNKQLYYFSWEVILRINIWLF